MWVVNNRKLFYSVSGILVLLSFASLFVWGLKPGIDFTGGTLIDVSYPVSRPSQSAVLGSIASLDKNASVRPSGDKDYIIRMRPISQEEHTVLSQSLSLGGSAQPVEKTFDSIGPVLGLEALKKAYVSIALVILGIVLYITFAFRKVSEPVSSWKYGLVAIVALIHDVIIPTGVFSLLGHLAGYEVDTLFVTALLVVLGFSVHDTIVVFDRVRENLKHVGNRGSFDAVVGTSISQTFTRSINTSLTTLIALVILYFVGGSITQHFSLALIIGIAVGTYSSVFIGSPLLVTVEKMKFMPNGKWVFWWFIITYGLIGGGILTTSIRTGISSVEYQGLALILSVLMGLILYRLTTGTNYFSSQSKKIALGILASIVVGFATLLFQWL